MIFAILHGELRGGGAAIPLSKESWEYSASLTSTFMH